jgi:hypothetical protein
MFQVLRSQQGSKKSGSSPKRPLRRLAAVLEPVFQIPLTTLYKLLPHANQSCWPLRKKGMSIGMVSAHNSLRHISTPLLNHSHNKPHKQLAPILFFSHGLSFSTKKPPYINLCRTSKPWLWFRSCMSGPSKDIDGASLLTSSPRARNAVILEAEPPFLLSAKNLLMAGALSDPQSSCPEQAASSTHSQHIQYRLPSLA